VAAVADGAGPLTDELTEPISHDGVLKGGSYMKRNANVFAILTAVVLCGCGGGSAPVQKAAAPTPSAVPTPDITGNWQFSVASTSPGKPPLSFAGGISQVGTAVSGAMHVDGSDCFNELTTMGLTGTAKGGNTSLTSTAINGQVVTFTGNFTNAAFTGIYEIKGGCGANQQEEVSGVNVPYVGGPMSGTFTDSAQKTFHVTGYIAQNSYASSDGSSGVTGEATFDTPCLPAATIRQGTFLSGSFVLGTTVGLEFDTGNGILTFLGTLSEDKREISGNYTVAGGSCDDAGTSILVLGSPWDY
jgi:hypothetical protein